MKRAFLVLVGLCIITNSSLGSVVGFQSTLEKQGGSLWALEGQQLYRDDTGEVKYGWVSFGPLDTQTNNYDPIRQSSSVFDEFTGFINIEDPLDFWEFETLVFDREVQDEGLIEFSITVQGIDYTINEQKELFRFTNLIGSIFPPGDWDGSGVFDSGDILKVFQEGLYETGEPAHFGQGDSDGDQLFNTSDFIYSLSYGNYEDGTIAAKAFSVPEPNYTFYIVPFVLAYLLRLIS